MRWFARALQLLPPGEQLDVEIGDTLLHLSGLLREAEDRGEQFRPSAKLARAALRAIYWR